MRCDLFVRQLLTFLVEDFQNFLINRCLLFALRQFSLSENPGTIDRTDVTYFGSPTSVIQGLYLHG